MLSIDAVIKGRVDDYGILKKNGALVDVRKAGEGTVVSSVENISSLSDNIVDETHFEDKPVEIEIDEVYLASIDAKEHYVELDGDLDNSDTDEIIINDYLAESADDENIILLGSVERSDNESEAGAGFSIESSEKLDTDERIEYKIEIDETGLDALETDDLDADSAEVDSTSEGVESDLEIDPVLLSIYYDESQSHINTVQQLVADTSANKKLQADKTLLRAFHTLYGSARTAGIEPIAELSGTTEKYIKARQDIDEEAIPQDVTDVISEVEKSICNAC